MRKKIAVFAKATRSNGGLDSIKSILPGTLRCVVGASNDTGTGSSPPSNPDFIKGLGTPTHSP